MELQYKECLVRDPSKSSHQRKLAYLAMQLTPLATTCSIGYYEY